jgi:hypothetical protein
MLLKRKNLFYTALLSLVFITVTAQIHAYTMPDPGAAFKQGPLFPRLFFTETFNQYRIAETSKPYWVHTQEEHAAIRRTAEGHFSILLNNDILAYYGHPRSRQMGILGRHPKEELHARLTRLAGEYQEAGGRNVITAFYIIYGTVWPEGEIGIINHDLLRQWIEFALQHNMLIFIDHQIGRHDPVESVRRMFPWLHYPNVHLAFDPEWRTSRPMREIGFVTGDEINRAQQVMEDYLIEHNLGERILLFHQFDWRMIRNRDSIRADFDLVRLVHCISGFGTPEEKRETYDVHGARATNMPLKGFKLWYDCNIHIDNPLMTPSEVFELVPRPSVIMYQ